MTVNSIADTFKNKYAHKALIFVIDLVSSLLASILSVGVLSIFWVDCRSLLLTIFLYSILFSLVASIISILSAGSYRVHIRHTTLNEVWKIFTTSLLKAALMFVMLWILQVSKEIPLQIKVCVLLSILDLLITAISLITIRVLVISVYEYILRKANGDNLIKVLIYGDNQESVSVGMMLIKSLKYKVVGYVVPEEETKVNRGSLCGRPVYVFNNESQIKRIINTKGINTLVFPNYETARTEKKRLIEYCAQNGVTTSIANGVNEYNREQAIIPPLKNVKIEELLGREEVQINMDEINKALTDKVVLVTGAAGSIGSEICRQLLNIPLQKLILFDSAETPMNDIYVELDGLNNRVPCKYIIGDVRDPEKLDYVFNRYKPNIVFHAAAYKHVPMMENNPIEAVNTNVFGTMNVAMKSVEYGVEKFVMISTDKAVNPANVMGASKRIAEIYTQSLSGAIAAKKVAGITKFVTTRFGNVLGSNGSVIPLFKKQIAAGGPITVTDPRIIRFFMTIPEACRLVLEAGCMGKEDEIFVFDMGAPVKIIDLAKNMITLSGLKEDQDIKIKIVGLRPGEKLYEELLNDEENTIPTDHKRIFLAKVRKYDYNDVLVQLEELRKATKGINKELVVSKMKEIVPEFKSCNSRYGRLD